MNSSLLRAGERRDEDLRIDKKVAGGRSRRNSEKILEPVPYKLGDDCFPAGVFKPDVHGSADTNPPLPARVEAKAFAMTIEAEQGSSTPTMPIVMMGAGE